MMPRHSRVLVPLFLALGFVAAAGGAARAQTLRANSVKLSAKDSARLQQTAKRFEREIRAKYTPIVDLHITEGSQAAGIRFTKVNDPRVGSKGGTVFEVTGVEKAGGQIDLILTGGASGHVMQDHYGGRPLSVVEGYGQSDTIHLTYKAPGSSRSMEVLNVKSRGLVTQEGFTLKLGKGEHNFWYFRGGPREASGGEGSEPELRQITFKVK